jgi:hypothetical protein
LCDENNPNDVEIIKKQRQGNSVGLPERPLTLPAKMTKTIIYWKKK